MFYPYYKLTTGPKPTPIAWADLATTALPDTAFGGLQTDKVSFDEPIDAGSGDIYGAGKLVSAEIRGITPTITLVDKVDGDKAIIKRVNSSNELIINNRVNKPGTGLVTRTLISHKDGVAAGEAGILTIGEADGSITLVGTVTPGTLAHNSLSSIQGGTTAQYYHLTSAEYSALHAAVTIADTASVDLSLTGQQISAAVLPAGVDHNSLANLTTGDPHTQYQQESEKNAASGYCGLDSTVQVTGARLGSGTPVLNDILAYNDTPQNGKWIAQSAIVAGTVASISAHLATSVTSEETFGIAKVVGTSALVARQDHTHGSPSTVLGEFQGDLPNAYLRFKVSDQEQTNQDSGLVLRSLTGTQYRKMSNLYTAQTNNTLRQVVFYLSAAPTNGDGYVWAELWSDDGGSPGKPNALLATSSKVHLADMDTGTAEVAFNFLREAGARVTLGTKYHLVLNGDYTLSDSATCTAYIQTAITTNEFSYYDGAAWQSYSTYTMYFKAIVGTNSQDINLTSFSKGGGRLNISNLPDSIPDRKLAQITTASKVSGAALTGLASVPAGAGILPTANLPLTLAAQTTGFTIAGGTTPKTLTVSDSIDLAANSITFAGLEVLTLAAAKNVTFADAFVTQDAYSITLRSTGATSVFLPTTGVLATLSGAEAFNSKTFYNGLVITPNTGVITTGTWNATAITVPYGGTGATTLTGLVQGNGTSAFTANTFSEWGSTAWTPTFANVSAYTISVARYRQVGKTVEFYARISLSTGASVTGAVTFNLPVATSSNVPVGFVIGHGDYIDVGGSPSSFVGVLTTITNTSTCRLNVAQADSTYTYRTAIGAAIPFTWAQTDVMSVYGYYEVD